MGKQVLLDTRIFAGGADLTSQSNKVELSGEVQEKPTTNYGSGGAQEVLGGIFSARWNGEGQWEAGDTSKVDDDAWLAIGGIGPLTTCPGNTANVGDLAYLMNALRTTYKLGDAVGEVAPWTSQASSTWPVPRGVVLHPPGTARSTTGSGTAVQHLAVATGQYLYAAVHVLSVAGTTPSITVKIQSDDNSGMTTPTDRITFNAANARSGQISRLAGPITDDYFRASWTISGTTPSFLFVVALGVR